MYGVKIHKKSNGIFRFTTKVHYEQQYEGSCQLLERGFVFGIRCNFFVEKMPSEGQEQPRWLSKTMQNDEKQEIDESGVNKYIVDLYRK